MKFSQEQVDDTIIPKMEVGKEMKYTNPYICDYLKFFIEKRENPINQRTKDYDVAFHSRNGFFGEATVLSKEDLKGLADFIYETIGEKE